MKTFDQMLPTLAGIFSVHKDCLAAWLPLLINRDLNARVRLIVDAKWQHDPQALAAIQAACQAIHEQLGPHAYASDRAVLFDENVQAVCEKPPAFALLHANGDVACKGVFVIDRLATEGSWSLIAPPQAKPARVVFFSIKGGVGRSTALAVAAWHLAQQGKRVLVLDLDLESPGLLSALLPNERQPSFGITDWLVEDLVDNGDAVFGHMVATSPLSRDGDIYVVPAHGHSAGEYVAKLGRVWMPKVSADGVREPWPQRLQRLLTLLEGTYQPDVVLIDSRSGIDEIASACVTDLGAALLLLFALDGEQTWSGYRALFQHWHTTGVVRDIRERLQVVGAMLPVEGRKDYFQGLRDHAYDLFADDLYEAVAPGEPEAGFTYALEDELAPHSPWPILWHPGFAALRAVYGRLDDMEPIQVEAIFGSFLDPLLTAVIERSGDAP